ncbi:MAG: hypothetical protein KDA80_22600, partial [Planctomycetaceae bacterium]|nr:hypothetical protein [Planctomycetaceae bacterium]
MPILLGLDLGTTSHSVVAIDGQRRVVAEWNRDHHAEVSGLPSGYAEQNPKIHLNSAVSLLKDIAAQCPEPPVGLGITGQMHGVVFSDGAGRAVSPVITWQDKRAAQPNPLTGKTDLETLLERCPDSAIQSSGCRLSTGYLGTTCYSLQRAAQIPDRATTASLLISWMGAQLTGEKVVTDPSAAGSTGLYDLERGCWSEPLVEAVGISLSLLPEVRSSGEPIGTLCSKVSAETGLPREMAIMNPLGDNQASVMGSVPQATKEIQVTVGTGGQINWPVDRFVRVPAMDTRSLPDNRFLLVGAGIVGGATYAWLNDTVRQWL